MDVHGQKIFPTIFDFIFSKCLLLRMVVYTLKSKYRLIFNIVKHLETKYKSTKSKKVKKYKSTKLKLDFFRKLKKIEKKTKNAKMQKNTKNAKKHKKCKNAKNVNSRGKKI